MFLRPVDLAFARFQRRRDARALAIVFDRTAGELLRVARHLASSEADAEDLVQATFLQAIEAAQQHRRGEPVLPWLLGILANRAHQARRAARRRPDPTRLRTDVVRDAAAEAIGNELGSELQAAIARLPEAYRPVLRMWLEHGLEAQQIAATLERPAGTVRAQIARGLDQLRRLLPRGVASGVAVAAVGLTAGRGLAAVRRELLGPGAGTSTGLLSTLALGGLLVLHHKLFAAAAALVVAFGLWSWWDVAPPGQPAVAAEGIHLPAAVASLDPEPAAPAALRTEVVATAAAAPPTSAAVPAPSTGELVVEVVAGTDGAPIAGIGVAVRHDDDHDHPVAPVEWLPTDSAGIVRFSGLLPARWFLDLDRLGAIAAADVVAGATVHRRIEVPAGLRVEGLVVDANDRPVAAAAIVVHGSRLAAPVVATSDANGRFAVDHLLPQLHLQAQKDGYAPSAALSTQGTGVAVTLRLATAGRRLDVRAVAADGRPLARATVAIALAATLDKPFDDRAPAAPRPLYGRTDAAGVFSTESADVESLMVVLQPNDGAHAMCWEPVPAGRDLALVELRAPAAAVLTGDIVGADHPATIRLQTFSRGAEPIGYLANLLATRVVTAGVDGHYRIDGLLAGDCAVIARKAFATVAETTVALQSGQATRWDVTVAKPGLPLRVVVRAAGPLPAGTSVMVAPHVPDNSAPSMAPLGADGTAEVPGLRAQNFDVVIAVFPGGRQYLPLARREDLPPGTAVVEFDLDATQLPARAIRGRVVDAAGGPIAGETVAFVRSDGAGLMVRVEAVTGADGAFASPRVPTGGYRLTTGGRFAADREIGTAVVTLDRDEDLGTLRVAR